VEEAMKVDHGKKKNGETKNTDQVWSGLYTVAGDDE
jgi:hypothetical protein